jgi:hypothetical protein
MTKQEIILLINIRKKLLDKDSLNKRIDEISEQVIQLFKDNFNDYEVDFMLETLTMFGQAPNVVYDDNGLFAISGDAYHPVVYGEHKLNGSISVLVKRNQWKKTIRLALKHYLKIK